MMRGMGTYTTLCTRREAWTRKQPATEAVIVVAVRSPRGAILLACFGNQAANLASRCGERTLMVVRLMARHGSDQDFKVVDHAVLRGRRGVRCDDGRTHRECILNIKDVGS